MPSWPAYSLFCAYLGQLFALQRLKTEGSRQITDVSVSATPISASAIALPLGVCPSLQVQVNYRADSELRVTRSESLCRQFRIRCVSRANKSNVS